MDHQEKKEYNSHEYFTAYIIMFVVIFVMLIIISFKLSDIRDNMENMDRKIDVDYSYGEIEDDVASIKEKLDKQTNLIDSYSIDYGQVNTANNTAIVRISVIPKTYTKDAKISVTLGESVVELENKNNRYVGNFESSIERTYSHFLVTIEDNGTIQSQTMNLEDEDGDYGVITWEDKYFSSIDIQGYEGTMKGNHKFILDIDELDFIVSEDEVSKAEPVLYLEVNGEVAFQKNLKKQYHDTFSIEGESIEVSAKEGDKIYGYITYQGKSGYTYKNVIIKGSTNDYDAFADYQGEVYDLNNRLLTFEYSGKVDY